MKQVGADLQGPDDNVRELSFPHEILRIDLLAVLRDDVEDLHPAGFGELLEFRKRVLPVPRVRFHANENGPLPRADPAGALLAGNLVLEVPDKPREVEIHPGGVKGIHLEPVATVGVFGDEVGRMDFSRQPALFHRHGADKIQAQQGQVRQVVPG